MMNSKIKEVYDKAVEFIRTYDYLTNDLEYLRCYSLLRNLGVTQNRFNCYSDKEHYNLICKFLKCRLDNFKSSKNFECSNLINLNNLLFNTTIKLIKLHL